MPDDRLGQTAARDAIVEFVIQGVTLEGKPFRPSDWAERLCGVMSAFGGDHRMQYSPYVHPVTTAGIRCVVVDGGSRRSSRWLIVFCSVSRRTTTSGPATGVSRSVPSSPGCSGSGIQT